MKKKYRNELFNLFNTIGLNQSDFELVEETDPLYSGLIFSIRYKDSPFRFFIRNPSDSFEKFKYKFVKFGPDNTTTQYLPLHSWINFSSIQQEFIIWIETELQEYLDDQSEPDLWLEYKKGNSSLNVDQIDFYDKVDFSSDEKMQVSLAINDLKLLIHNNLQTTEEEQKLVVERLDYLIESAKRLNKFDWKSLALSSLISISIALSLDTDKGQMLFDLFKKVFSILPPHLPGK